MRGTWKIELTVRAEGDFASLAEHLAETYASLGQEVSHARRRALLRTRALRKDLNRLRHTPHRGTRHDEHLAGLRSVTFDTLAVWFLIDEDRAVVRVLAVFFSGQDQHARMLARLAPPQG